MVTRCPVRKDVVSWETPQGPQEVPRDSSAVTAVLSRAHGCDCAPCSSGIGTAVRFRDFSLFMSKSLPGRPRRGSPHLVTFEHIYMSVYS